LRDYAVVVFAMSVVVRRFLSLLGRNAARRTSADSQVREKLREFWRELGCFFGDLRRIRDPVLWKRDRSGRQQAVRDEPPFFHVV
jgi:hypothetical protein